MPDIPEDLTDLLRDHGQEHLLEVLNDSLLDQLWQMDLEELSQLTAMAKEGDASTPPRIAPLPVESWDDIQASKARGEQALRDGEVAVLVVAGGQGSRLGFEHPKGHYKVGPVSEASLFQIHAEKVLALSRRYEKRIPLLVMTSTATHDETVAYFAEQNFFGLQEDDVLFFQQGTMPAVDMATGQLLLESPEQFALSPNGHGGTLIALADSGILKQLQDDGIAYIFYFQVDNPLVRIADPVLLGRHIETNAEVSSKVVFKEKPEEKVGLLTLINDRCGIIEYSDMPAELTNTRDTDGTLLYRAGNPAIHLFSVDFLTKVTSGEDRLQFHIARKKVPYFDLATQSVVTPTTENAFKFELFIFDALPLADRWLVVSVNREDEFAPLKNATGSDSPATVRELLIAQATRWLTAAGVSVPPGTAVEISPLFALDEIELKSKLTESFQLTGPTYLK
ncbi:UDPGP type 1 family protein [soil metagenome]